MQREIFEKKYRPRLENLSTTNLSDALDKIGLRGAVIGIRPLFGMPKIVGPAVTIKITAAGIKHRRMRCAWRILMGKGRIGILTGGGDCPGLNAVIRGVTKIAINTLNLEVIGFYDGFLGLIENRYSPLTFEKVSGILTQGGTILGSDNKTNPFEYVDRRCTDLRRIDVSDQCLELYQDLGLDALICVGGDGTMTIAGKLAATSTSGPGLALKSEAIGLAVITELPLVIIDVQRGGPSTGLPTKTSQKEGHLGMGTEGMGWIELSELIFDQRRDPISIPLINFPGESNRS